LSMPSQPSNATMSSLFFMVVAGSEGRHVHGLLIGSSKTRAEAAGKKGHTKRDFF